MAEPELQPVPRQLRAGSPRLLVRHAVQLRPGADPPVRPVAQPGQLRQEGAAAELREHPGPVRGLHRPLDQQAHPVHGNHLLAGQQGLAEPAVEPLQQRRRPGRSLLRRAGGQPEPARVLRPGQPRRGRGQPDRLAAGRPVRRGPGVQPGRAPAGRRAHRPVRAGQPAGQQRSGPAAGAARDRPARPGPGLLRAAAAAPARCRAGQQRLLAVHPARRAELARDPGQPAGHDDVLREPARAELAPDRGGHGAGGHLAAARTGRRRPGDQGDDHEHLGRSDGGLVPARRRPAGHSRRPGACRATAS